MLFESLTPPTLVTGQESKHRCPVVLGGVPKLTETQLFQCPESALRPPPTRTSLTHLSWDMDRPLTTQLPPSVFNPDYLFILPRASYPSCPNTFISHPKHSSGNC